MKKFIAIALSMVVAWTFVVPALAVQHDDVLLDVSEKEYCEDVIEQIADSTIRTADARNQINLEDSFYLYNFADQPIAIYYKLEPVGYAIYDFIASTVLEYTTECEHPFYVDASQKYYYEGVFNYYKAVPGGFENLATGQIKTINSQYEFTSSDFYHNSENNGVTTKASEGPVYLENDTRLYNCNTAENLSYFYPDLSQADLDDCPGICGSLACAVLIAYFDDYRSDLAGNGDFATDWKKVSGEGTDDAYGKPLVKELVALIEPSANGSVFLNPGVSAYLRERDITGRVSMGALTVYQQTKNAIGSDGSGDPLIVGTTSHYSVGVGYKNISKKQIYTNTGYGYHSWINASTIISTWTMHID